MRLSWLAAAAGAQGVLDPVVVIGSVRAPSAAQTPYASSVIDQDTLRNGGPMLNLSESMARVPGLVVANRNHHAQDLQISAGGFGARSGFGVRGIRLYTDGIPASMPDGQGQVCHFDLAGAKRIEVLRGPFSVLYGNSSGGVIALVSTEPTEVRAEGEIDIGRLACASIAPARPARWATTHPAWTASSSTPTRTSPPPRKTTRQLQLGAGWKHLFSLGALSERQLSLYSGKRAVTQWLAIAAGTQGNPAHGGGVIDFDREFGGINGRLTRNWDTLDVVAGVSHETMSDTRLGCENFTGSGASQLLGVTGRLRRDEGNRARTSGGQARFEWRPTAAWAASGGVRTGRATLCSADHFLANGNDSGQLRFNDAMPVLGLRWTAAPGLNLHTSLARGFESPTLGDLAYRPDGIGSFNTTLRPQKSTQRELGAKWRVNAVQLDAALFKVDVTDEIGVASNAGGRSSFKNVGRTRRSGAELAARWQPTPSWRTLASVTLLNARYRDGFLTGTRLPCGAAAVPVAAGNRIAGTQRGNAFGELAWRQRHQRQRHQHRRHPRYALLNLRASKTYPLPDGMRLQLLLRVDNVFDRVDAGSVIVNDASGRFFEAGAPRSLMLAVRLPGKP